MTFPAFDPSKMHPKVLMELSRLVQQLPPEQLNRMQTLMHNAMAGFDVKKEMEDFERSLPPDFREKMMGLMLQSASAAPNDRAEGLPANEPELRQDAEATDYKKARLTILRAVADGSMSPEEAERLLF